MAVMFTGSVSVVTSSCGRRIPEKEIINDNKMIFLYFISGTKYYFTFEKINRLRVLL